MQIVDANAPVEATPVKVFAAKPRLSRGLGRMLAALLATTSFAGAAHATDATFTGASTGEWTDGTNWSSDPLVPDNIATFDNTFITNIVNDGGPASINTVVFTGTAVAYTFTFNNGFIFQGAGIQNNSANVQDFIAFDQMVFSNSSTVTGNVQLDSSGFLLFQNNSSAGTATLGNNDITEFFDSSTAGTATIVNGAEMDFFDSSTAGSASFTNQSLGTLTFNTNASAQNATITNNGGTVTFGNSATAASSSILNNSGTVEFGNSATAASSNITNTSGFLNFRDTSTAGAATITTDSGTTSFFDSASGGTATFVMTAGGDLDISNLTAASTKVGSIAAAFGDGFIDLGSKQLQVGGNNASTIFGGLIQDAGLGGSLYKEGTGTLTLSFGNTYIGGTTIAGGKLAITADNNLGGAAGGLTLQSGGTLLLNAAVSSARNVVLGAGGGVFDTNGNSETWSGTFTGAGGFTKAGAGTLTLSGAGSYGGATAVNVGTLQAGVVNAFSASSAYTVAAGAVLDLNSLNQTIGSLAGAGNVTLGSAKLTEGGDNSSTTYSGVMSGTGGLIKAGTGTTTLSAANNYSGTTTVNAGTLKAGIVNAFGNLSAVTVAAGATLDLNNFNQTIGSLAGAGNVTLGTATLTEGGDDTATSFSGTISGTGGLTKVGIRTTSLYGPNNYSGATAVNVGSLQAGDVNVFSASSAHTVAVGAVIDLLGFSQTIGSLAGAGNVTLFAATLTTGGNNSSTTYSGVMSGTGGLTKAGTGTMTLSGANTYSGATNVNAGALKAGIANAFGNLSAVTVAAGATLDANSLNQTIGSLAGAGNVTLGSATLTEGGNNSSTTFSGVISGSGGLTKVGTGTTTLSGANAYSGPTNVNAGALKAGIANAFGNLSAVTAAAGATLDLNSFNQTIGSLAGAGAVTLGTATLTEGGDNSSTTYSGVMSGTGGLTKAGTGTTTLSGANTYGGATNVNAGTLRAGVTNAFGTLSAVIVAAGATLDLNSFNQTIGSLAGAGNVTLGSATLTEGGDNSSTTYSGVISGTGGLTKVGTGTTTLTGVNLYSGATLINAGVLSVNGSIANSVVTIGANGTLKGTGTVGGVVTGGGSTVAPGNSIGTLNVAGNVNFAAGSIYQVELNAGGASDKIAATGATTLGGGTVQALGAPGVYANSTTYVILTSTGGVTGQFSAVTSNIPYLIPTLTYKPTEVDLTLSIINLVATAQTPNQIAVSSAVQAGGVFSGLYTVLFPLNAANSRLAYDALSGEIYASMRSQALTDGETVREAVLGRMRDTSGDTGNGVWIHAFQGWDKLDGNANAATLGGNLSGILAGADTDVGGNVRLGVDAGYTHTTAVVNARGSALTANSTHAGVYGALRSGDFSFGVAAQGAWGYANTMRSVAFPGFADGDASHQDARTLQAVAEAGYHSNLGSVSFDPFANFGWISVNNGAFAETGGIAALSGTERESDVTFSNLGVRAGADFLGGGGLHIMPNASVAWQHGFGGLTPARTLTFQSIAQGFTVTGVPLDEDEALVSANLALQINSVATFTAGYQGSISQHTQSNGVHVGFDWRF